MSDTLQTIGIVMPGDMGHACGAVLRQYGFTVVTALSGRSRRTRMLSEQAEIQDLGLLNEVVRQSDLILSILPPQHAYEMAETIAGIMQKTNNYPDFADCNAISPNTVLRISKLFDVLPTLFIDGGIVGLNPIKEKEQTRLYVSGENLGLISQMDGKGLKVNSVGSKIGQASTLKMLYASATKGAFSLFATVAVMSELTGLRDELFSEFSFSKPDILNNINHMVPRIPVDAARWMHEMDEISDTYRQFGMTPKFHEGAKELMHIADRTPLSSETRETLSEGYEIEEVLKMYKEALKPNQWADHK